MTLDKNSHKQLNTVTATEFNLTQIGITSFGMPQILKDYLNLYYIRQVETYISQKYSLNVIRTPVHLCNGQEAIPVGISNNLFQFDKVLSGHRSHGHFLSKGGNLTSLFAEILGKESGCAKGRGGSQHLIDLKINFIASAPILGGTIPISVGLAFANKLSNYNGIVVCYFGDAVLEEGVFYESVSFSSLHKLPILFVVENNKLSVHTPLSSRQPNRVLADIAKAFGVVSMEIEGNDTKVVTKAAASIISQIREGQGPAILFCETYRQNEHVGPGKDLKLGYRDLKEYEYWIKKDPLIILREQIGEDSMLSNTTIDQLPIIDNYIENCWTKAFNSSAAIPN